MGAVAGDVRHQVPARGLAEAVQLAIAGRDLFDGPRRSRRADPEQVIAAADPAAEVHVSSIGTPRRRARQEIPCGRDVRERAPSRADGEDVVRGAVILLRRDHRAQSLLAPYRNRSPVRRPRGRVVVVPVVGEPRRFPVKRHGPQIRARVGVFIALELVGDERQRAAVGSPRGAAHVDANFGELLRVAALARDDEQFFRRRRFGIAGIRQVAALIESILHPLVRLALEPLVDQFFGVRRVGRRLRLRDPLGERDPLVVRAEDRRALDAANVNRRLIQPIRPQEPDRSTLVVSRRPSAAAGEGQELPVGTPARSGRIQRRIREATRGRAAIGRHDPQLALAPVLGLHNRRPDERHPPAVRRRGGRLNRDDAVVVLDCQLSGGDARGQQSCREHPRQDCHHQVARSEHGDLPAADSIELTEDRDV